MQARGDHGRRRPVLGAAGHVRRRARLGAVPGDRVRRAPLGHAARGRPAARPGAGRLPRDRLAAAREGLPGVGRRHHERDRSVLVGTRVRGAHRQGVPRDAMRCRAPDGTDRGSSRSCSTTTVRLRSATSRCGRRPATSSAACRAGDSATSSTRRSPWRGFRRPSHRRSADRRGLRPRHRRDGDRPAAPRPGRHRLRA